MSKRLILVLALAFVVGVTCAAYAEVQNVKVSGDITLTGIMRADYTLKNNTPDSGISGSSTWSGDKQEYLLRQVRVRVDADLTDNVSATVRLLNEGTWGDTKIYGENGNDDEVSLDLAYVTMKEFLYSPLTLKLGRQEIQFGNGMIVGDPDTNLAATGWGGTAGVVMANNTSWFYTPAPDLSLRKAFDAVRVTLDYDPLVIDGIYAVVKENNVSQDDDTNLFGVNAAYDFKDKMKTVGEAYYFAKYIGRKANDSASRSKVDRTDTIGLRVKTEPIENLTTQVEGAFQFGEYDPVNDPNDVGTQTYRRREAWAGQAMASYNLDMKYKPVVSGVYAFFSGERKTSTGRTGADDKYHGWDPMFENQTFGHIMNSLMEQTNMHIVGLGAKATPMEDITLDLNYYAYRLQRAYNDLDSAILNGLSNGQTYRMSNKKFLGQELDMSLVYDYTEDVQFSLLAGMFLPGKAFYSGGGEYAKNNNAATELIGSMKVTF